MPEILRSGRRRSLVASLLALLLVASACGADSDEAVTAADESSPASDGDSSDESGAEGSGSDESGSEGTAEASAEDAAAGTEEDEDGAASETAGENLFPDIDVVNIVDGSNVNLAAELGGGDLPVLLWFWAPH